MVIFFSQTLVCIRQERKRKSDTVKDESVSLYIMTPSKTTRVRKMCPFHRETFSDQRTSVGLPGLTVVTIYLGIVSKVRTKFLGS